MASPSKSESDWLTDHISCETHLNIVKLSYTWTLHKFSLRQEKPGEKINSSTFSTAGHGNLVWCLELYPNGACKESQEFLCLHLQLVSSDDNVNSVVTQYKLAVLAKGGRQDNVRIESARIHRGCAWGWGQFIQRECLLRSKDLLPNDKLTIYCEVLAFVDSVNISTQNRSKAADVPECRLSEDLGHLLESRRFWDVILSVGGREIHAHKGILAARCSVFAAMFEREAEHKNCRMEIRSCDYDVLREVVEFIYTGCTPRLNKMAKEVLVAADKYDLERLKAMCERILGSKLSVRTAADMLKLADLHRADQLKANALRFIKEHASDVIETDGWKLVASEMPHLVLQVCSMVAIENQALKTKLKTKTKEMNAA